MALASSAEDAAWPRRRIMMYISDVKKDLVHREIMAFFVDFGCRTVIKDRKQNEE
jgi:hypothetical protein